MKSNFFAWKLSFLHFFSAVLSLSSTHKFDDAEGEKKAIKKVEKAKSFSVVLRFSQTENKINFVKKKLFNFKKKENKKWINLCK